MTHHQQAHMSPNLRPAFSPPQQQGMNYQFHPQQPHYPKPQRPPKHIFHPHQGPHQGLHHVQGLHQPTTSPQQPIHPNQAQAGPFYHQQSPTIRQPNPAQFAQSPSRGGARFPMQQQQVYPQQVPQGSHPYPQPAFYSPSAQSAQLSPRSPISPLNHSNSPALDVSTSPVNGSSPNSSTDMRKVKPFFV